MKDKLTRIISSLLIIVILLPSSLVSCKGKNTSENDGYEDGVSVGANPNDKENLDNSNAVTPESAKKIILTEITGPYEIKYKLDGADAPLNDGDVRVFTGDNEVSVLNIASSSADSNVGIINLEDEIDLTVSYRVQIAEYGESEAIPTTIFDSEYFIENCTYSGNDLGATVSGGSTVFKVWAPTASRITVNLYTDEDSDSAHLIADMEKGDNCVWSYSAECGHGAYYTYTVTTPAGTADTQDPYAKLFSADGTKGIVIDPKCTDIERTDDLFETQITSYSDAVIWGITPYAFSSGMRESNYKGKYLAFTERGLTNENGVSIGVDHLVNLGITHVNLISVYDYIPHGSSTTTSLPFQKNNAPNPKYAVSEADVMKEYKEMVSALHNAGIGIVADVSFAPESGEVIALNKIVPHYYCRYEYSDTDYGKERYMMSKFISDSASYLVNEYGIDGLCFRSMGYHDLETMQRVENAVHKINPKAILYGDGAKIISAKDTADSSNIEKIPQTPGAVGGIAVFNDVMRDGLAGDVDIPSSRGYVNGNSASSIASVVFGISGGSEPGFEWSVGNSTVINYSSDHTSKRLFERLEISNPSSSEKERLEMYRLATTLLMISKGGVFLFGSEEMLLDGTNQIRWSELTTDSDGYKTALFYKALIEFRRSGDILTSDGVETVFTRLTEGRLCISLCDEYGKKALILVNPTSSERSYTLYGSWNLVMDKEGFADDSVQYTDGITLPPRSVIILFNDLPLGDIY